MNQKDAKRKLAKLENDMGEIKKLLSGSVDNEAAIRRAAWRPKGPAAIALALGAFILAAVVLHAAPLTKPNDFTSGTVISSSEMNANFDTLYAVSHPRTFVSASGAVASFTVVYALPGVTAGTEISMPMPDSGTLRTLRLDITINSLSGPAVFRLRLNGVYTPVGVAVPTGASGVFADLVNSASFNAGDRLSIEVDTTGALGGSMGEFGFSFQY